MTSFIICSIDAVKFKAISQNIAERMAGEPHEVLGVHDAKSLCEGYNRAVPHARGGTIVFCHDDIEILTPDFRHRLRGHMARFDVAGVAGTRRVIAGTWSFAGAPYLFGHVAHPEETGNGYLVHIYATPKRAIDKIAALDGLFIAVRREVLTKIRFDETTFDGWHGYDIDFTFAAHLAGFRLGVMADVQLLQSSVGKISGDWQKYVQLFNRKHLDKLYPMPRRQFVINQLHVATKAELLEVMTPPYWDEP